MNITNEKELLEYTDKYFANRGINVKLKDYKEKSNKPRTYFGFKNPYPNINKMQLLRFEEDLKQEGLILEPNGVNSYAIKYVKKQPTQQVKLLDLTSEQSQIEAVEVLLKEQKGYTKEDIIHSAGSFERNFKKMIRFQGYAASPMITAQIMIKTMNGSDKKQLQNTFSAMGIKNSEDLQNILSRWKIEALTKKQIPIKKVIGLNRAQSHSINM